MDRQRLLLDTYTSAIYRQSLSKNITTASITVYVIIKIDVIILDRDAWKNRMPEIVQMTAKMDSVFRTRWFRTALFLWSPAPSRIKEFLGTIKVKSLTTMDVEQFLDSLVIEHKSQARTLKDIKSLLVSIIDQAVKDGLVADNPAKEATVDKALVLKNAKEKNDDDNFFSYKEAQLFLVIVESHALYELFYITLFFGLRREEVLGLRWSCVDLDKKEFRINHTVTKGTSVNRLNSTKTEASARKYPLTEEQVKMFEHLKAKEAGNRALFGSAYHDNEYIFKHEDGSPYYPDYPTKAFGRVIKAHPELPQHVTFHGLRASCVSILVHEGFDVKRIQKWVGHSDINTTLKIYARVREKEAKQEILNGMNEIIHTKAY